VDGSHLPACLPAMTFSTIFYNMTLNSFRHFVLKLISAILLVPACLPVNIFRTVGLIRMNFILRTRKFLRIKLLGQILVPNQLWPTILVQLPQKYFWKNKFIFQGIIWTELWLFDVQKKFKGISVKNPAKNVFFYFFLIWKLSIQGIVETPGGSLSWHFLIWDPQRLLKSTS